VKEKPAKPAKANQSASNPASTANKTDQPAKPAKAMASKPAVKTATKAKSASMVEAKKVAKPDVMAKPTVKKSASKSVAKALPVSAKAAAKKAPNVAAKPVAHPGPVAASKKAALMATPSTTLAPAVQAKSIPASNGLPVPPPLKPGRRSSSRALAHMPPPAPMVPTHAPDAAKASYSTMTERVIAPPPHVAAKKDPKLANNWKTKSAETLTDEEVRAMPDTEYMNDSQMAFFRYKLSILKQDIHNSAGATTEHLREDTSVVPDPADRATIEEEHALELRTRDRERKLLKKIEQSIGRIDSGDYGYCDETGEPIGVGRLIARPTASLSLEAQQRRELKQKMFGD
jgi:DnaK suppressor protein